MNKEARRNGKCTCLTCEHIRQITKLIPDDDLRNKVLEVTDGLYEAMASESMDLSMEVIAKDKKIKELEKTATDFQAMIGDLEKQLIKTMNQLDNISEDKIVRVLKAEFGHYYNVPNKKYYNKVAKARIKLRGES